MKTHSQMSKPYLSIVGTAVLIAVCVAPPARAADDGYVSAQETSTALANIDASLLLVPSAGASIGSLTLSPGVAVHVPTNPDVGVDVSVRDLDMTIALPGSSTADEAVELDDGTVTYPADEFSTSVITSDTAVQFLTTISGAEAPTRYEYDIKLPKGARLEKVGEGVAVLDRTGNPILTTYPAWAVDADGEAVPTRFAVEGGSLVQYVEHRGGNVAYPVVADPKFAWWGVLPTVKLTRNETYKMRYASTPTKLALCVSLGGLAGVALAVPCAASLAVLSVKAGTVYASGKCLRVIIGPGILGGVDYKDSYCK